MKDIVVFDIETTGLNKLTDHIVQFSAMKINKGKIIDDLNLYIQPEGNYTMSIQAYLKHHIKPSALLNAPKLVEVADQIIDFIGDNTLLGYNIVAFDIPFLDYHLRKIGKHIDFKNRRIYDSFLIENKVYSLNLEQTYKRYKGKTMEECGLKPHDSYSDIKATYSVFYGQLINHNELVKPENFICADGFIKIMDFLNKKDEICFAHGKYKNLPVSYIKQIDNDYIQWILDSNDFSDELKNIVRNI